MFQLTLAGVVHIAASDIERPKLLKAFERAKAAGTFTGMHQRCKDQILSKVCGISICSDEAHVTAAIDEPVCVQ